MISTTMNGFFFFFFYLGFSTGLGNVGGLNISHLLFPNDTLIFCGTSPY